MVEIVRIDLAEEQLLVGSLHFVRAEWWKEAPRFVLLRYEVNGYVQPLGVRLDIDKAAVLDSVDSPQLDDEIKRRTGEILDAVIRRLPAGMSSYFSGAIH